MTLTTVATTTKTKHREPKISNISILHVNLEYINTETNIEKFCFFLILSGHACNVVSSLLCALMLKVFPRNSSIVTGLCSLHTAAIHKIILKHSTSTPI